VNEYFEASREYFASGTRFSIYTQNVDYFAKQQEMNVYAAYERTMEFAEPEPKNWWYAFSDGKTLWTDEAGFWAALHQWYEGPGATYQGDIMWADHKCNACRLQSSEEACHAPVCAWDAQSRKCGAAPAAPKPGGTDEACQPGQGIRDARSQLVMLAEYSDKGNVRYDTMVTIRRDLNQIFDDPNGDSVYPFSFEMLYWEEMGVIDHELIRNLVISGGVILGLICMLVPQPRVATLVALAIILSLVELVGIMHFWGVTINGVSTIYIMICVGLAVDYSAHIAHCFKESTAGRSVDRAMEALTRIGPSVFHAVFSTLLAVAVVGLSKSYIFRVFFKVLFVVTIVAGAHGLILLPTLLAVFGGSNEGAEKSVCGHPVGPASDVEAAKGGEVGQQQGPTNAAGNSGKWRDTEGKAMQAHPDVYMQEKAIGA
jgi:hypothetical protein